MIVCHCRAVSDRAVRAAIQDGAADVASVMAETRAGTCCGGCLPTVQEIVAEAHGTLERRPRPLRLVASPDRAA
jgi:NAD(P)H-nitrite reductase large subunit